MANELKYTPIFQKVSFGDFGFRILSETETSVTDEHFCAISPLKTQRLISLQTRRAVIQAQRIWNY